MPIGKKQLQRLIRLVAQLKENRYPNCSTVKYNGDIYSSTALTKKLLQYSGNLRPAPHWAYKDKKLSELYDECYRNE